MPDLLQLEEQQELLQCEAIIEKGLKTFFEVGDALSTIRNKRLYKAAHKTFEEYCKDKWGFQRQYANRFIAASETAAI